MNEIRYTENVDNFKTPNKSGCLDDSNVDEFTNTDKKTFNYNVTNLKKSFVNNNITDHFKNNHHCMTDNLVEETAKITYKHMSRVELKHDKEQVKNTYNSISNSNINISTSSGLVTHDKYYWFGAYDKLLNVKNMKKILKFFIDKNTHDYSKTFVCIYIKVEREKYNFEGF